MKTHTQLISISMAAVVLFLFGLFSISISSSSFAEADSSRHNPSLPPVQTQGETEFLTGGIGKDESEAILQEGRAWPLMLELAQAADPRPQYISDVRITVKDKSRNTVLDTSAEGPYLLIKLPSGKYSLDAVYESVKLHRHLDIREGSHKKITLLWPAAK